MTKNFYPIKTRQKRPPFLKNKLFKNTPFLKKTPFKKTFFKKVPFFKKAPFFKKNTHKKDPYICVKCLEKLMRCYQPASINDITN
jgi:hypothetical protein